MSRLGEVRLRLTRWYVARFRRFDAPDFAAALVRLGVTTGDTLMVHSSMQATSGYTGKPVQMIQALKEALGPQGLLVMPSMTYADSSKAYLLRAQATHLKRHPSRMGLLSEVFRRGQGVVRSASPTHPLLAWGADAQAFVAGHELTDRPFGPASPFARLLERDAKILCIDAELETITFMHFLEDRFSAGLAFALYDAEPLPGRVVLAGDTVIEVPTRVLSDESRRRRDEAPLWREAQRCGLIQRLRVGNAALRLAHCRDLESFLRTQPPQTLGIFTAAAASNRG